MILLQLDVSKSSKCGLLFMHLFTRSKKGDPRDSHLYLYLHSIFLFSFFSKTRARSAPRQDRMEKAEKRTPYTCASFYANITRDIPKKRPREIRSTSDNELFGRALDFNLRSPERAPVFRRTGGGRLRGPHRKERRVDEGRDRHPHEGERRVPSPQPIAEELQQCFPIFF